MKAQNKEAALEQHRKMTQTPIPKLITSLAIPSMISQLIMVIYNTADTYFVAKVGVSESAAVGVSFSLMALIQAVGFGIGMGCGSLISRKLGEKQEQEASCIGSSALAAGVLFGALLAAFGLLFLNDVMYLLGATETMLPHASAYSFWILLGAPIMCASFVLSNILRAEGAATFSMIGLVSGGIINVFLDPLLIFGLDMGASGAALATVVSQGIGLVYLASAFWRKKTIVRLRLRHISFEPKMYFNIIRVGFPTVCRQGMASVASACINVQGRVFGDAVVAALTISNKLYMIVRSFLIGMGQGYQPVAGYNYGDGKKRRVRQGFVFICQVGTVLCLASAAFMAWQAPALIGLFRTEPEVLKTGVTAVYFCSLALPFMAYSTYVNQLYQCLGFSWQATLLAACRQGIFYLPLAFLLPSLLGVTGLVLVQPLADVLTFVVSVPAQIIFFKRYLRATEAE